MGKKQENCDPDDPADAQKGDWWDHKAYDPEHRLVVCVVPGARNSENAEEVVAQFKRRTGGRDMNLITSDEHRPYKEAILQAYGVEATTTPSGLPVRAPHKVAPPALCYATVHKSRRLGRVVEIVVRLVFGTAALLAAALKRRRTLLFIATISVGRCERSASAPRTGLGRNAPPRWRPA